MINAVSKQATKTEPEALLPVLSQRDRRGKPDFGFLLYVQPAAMDGQS